MMQSNYIDKSLEYGFEVWMSRIIFDTNSISNEKREDIKNILYPLYNYWYHIICREILEEQKVQKQLWAIAEKIMKLVENEVITLNFDTILDKWLKPQHLHGRFQIPYDDVKQITRIRDNTFEWCYLFGGNGFEKWNRLSLIYKRYKTLKGLTCNLNFLFNNDTKINYGHMLIYGVSFSRSYIFSDEFLKAYPKHKRDYLVLCVDGHILKRPNQLYENGQVKEITLAYYSHSDLEHYKYLVGMTEFSDIVTYVQSTDIFDFV